MLWTRHWAPVYIFIILRTVLGDFYVVPINHSTPLYQQEINYNKTSLGSSSSFWEWQNFQCLQGNQAPVWWIPPSLNKCWQILFSQIWICTNNAKYYSRWIIYLMNSSSVWQITLACHWAWLQKMVLAHKNTTSLTWLEISWKLELKDFQIPQSWQKTPLEMSESTQCVLGRVQTWWKWRN